MNPYIFTLMLVLCPFALAGDTTSLKELVRKPAEATFPSFPPDKKPDPPPSFKATSDEPYIASFGVFGSENVTKKVVRKHFGKKLNQWFDKGLSGDPKAERLELELMAALKKKFNLAEAEFTILQYFEPGNLAVHVTLDVVEKKDVKRRSPFLPLPTREYPDPAKLIEKWFEYEQKAIILYDTGELKPVQLECRKALHCPFGHKHAKLKNYEPFFEANTKKYEKELLLILKQDKRPEFRAAATFLFPYTGNGKKVVKLMLERMRDPHPLVRNNVLRVLGDIAERHPQYHIPVKPLLGALSFPRVSDRAKALYVLYSLSLSSPTARKTILDSGIPVLLKLLTANQPNHWEVAHVILRKISGKDFPHDKPLAWKAWYDRLPANRKKAKKNAKNPKN